MSICVRPIGASGGASLRATKELCERASDLAPAAAPIGRSFFLSVVGLRRARPSIVMDTIAHGGRLTRGLIVISSPARSAPFRKFASNLSSLFQLVHLRILSMNLQLKPSSLSFLFPPFFRKPLANPPNSANPLPTYSQLPHHPNHPSCMIAKDLQLLSIGCCSS